MKTAPMAGKSRQPGHEPPCSKRNRLPSHCWNSGKKEGKGWEGNCLGDELPHYKMPENASCTYATLHYATTHKHMEFRHMRICVATMWPPTQALFVVNSVKLHLTAYKIWNSYSLQTVYIWEVMGPSLVGTQSTCMFSVSHACDR